MEQEIKAKEKAVKQAEKAKKQVILRIAPSLWEEIARWAEEDFRSINGQIEFILSKSVQDRKHK
ncbi:MAG: Arc family DNA-binding protein [Emergencia sp.]|uniref:Arc family DNA-binding protein n=2 Tax=Clostridia TaxID=186801 RepID=A0A845QK69_9FIRM|nr:MULTISPECIES: Arc family DNA-binding protein [Anaerotruncus]MCI9475438.1 Arc family DNA-binding protein [Emergencia sp.]NCE98896.1 Arc family DNA-binding protein [Emergencia sp. 1XD21-10]MCI9639550.1 Arc family DNA-binding protein [Emergencia sp.]NBH61087.1 Arc family DNA-binding protein [Anaerotruncus colihominis]NCF01742.1 Arc family DNA-binding protein [Anaerotruncus sp. 80]